MDKFSTTSGGRKTHHNEPRDGWKLFGLSDLTALFLIVITSGVVAGLPDLLDPDYPYATTILSVFTTIAQVIAPLIAVLVGLLFWRSDSGATNRFIDRTLRRALLLFALPLAISLLLIPVAETLRPHVKLRQGLITATILLVLYAIFDLIRSLLNSNPDNA